MEQIKHLIPGGSDSNFDTNGLAWYKQGNKLLDARETSTTLDLYSIDMVTGQKTRLTTSQKD
ncbi:hypothetical protein J4410_03320 [Candidatus Woesearchaeota archaeon]|nr:hypothetical protein [Candidatus Woesearchaeota archaeon]